MVLVFLVDPKHNDSNSATLFGLNVPNISVQTVPVCTVNSLKCVKIKVLICVKGWISAPSAKENFEIDNRLKFLKKGYQVSNGTLRIYL